MQAPEFDVAVIGGGIAGATAAAHIAPSHSLVLLEQENELAFHTTSRSAAIYLENEGGPIFHRLSTAGRPFFEDPPGAEIPLLTPLPVLSVGNAAMVDDLAAEVERARSITPTLRFVEGTELTDLCPVLRQEAIVAGMYEPNAASVDVMGLHQLFVRQARSDGTEIRRSSRVRSITRERGVWTLDTETGRVRAKTIVNAAGAWGDVIGTMVSAAPIGLTPLRRTAFTSPIAMDPSPWPFIYSSIPGMTCYFKPEAGLQLLCSLSDETPSEPTDARPEEIDIARAIDNINAISTVGIRSVKTSWAGLRTFAPDRNPVFGWDDQIDDFLWLVGQGGCGIVSAPAAGQIAAALMRGEPLPTALIDLGLTEAQLAPRR